MPTSPNAGPGFIATGCKVHGTRHQWRNYSNLCLHPACLRHLIISMAMRRPPLMRRWQLFQQMHLDEDVVQHVAYYLVTNPGVHHLNSTVLTYALSRFTDSAYRPTDERHTNYTKSFREHDRLEAVTPQTREDILGQAVAYVRAEATPMAIVQTLISEVYQHTDGNDALILLVTGQLDPEEYAILTVAPEDQIDYLLHLKEIMPWLKMWMQQVGNA